MIRVLVTGGVCSGKSHVCEYLASLGARVHYTDQIAHEVYSPGSATHAAILESFPALECNADQPIDRRHLGRLVFGDEAARDRLNQIVWPAVAQSVHSALEKDRAEGAQVAVVESALALEAYGGVPPYADRVWVCWVEAEEAVRRLMRRNGLEEPRARAVLAAQWSNEQRFEYAHERIHTARTQQETRAAVLQCWHRLLGTHPPPAM
eukprot:TRINITY_DN2936_c3_g1_i2.p2 TRINITY_DN2936_c3_g1~~TRINITY_DN2936_c3_g1_i2.p2  ORF type:complete len:207 (-),score=71.80 TRINITY_DN2936_c3_g1_i2:44-664(-)